MTTHIRNCHRITYSLAKGKRSDSSSVQTTLDDFAVTDEKRNKVVISALKWIITDMMPFSVMDSKNFQEFFNTCNPAIRLPCAATVRSKLYDYRLGWEEKLKKSISDNT
jgi:hypothetical protein